MVVDKVGGIGPNYGPKKIQAKVETSRPEALKDNVTISEAAIRQKNVDTIKKLALASDERADRIKEVKQKLADGIYDNPSDELLGQAASNIADVFLP
ncbi:MAG: flagellar biosynthesis anti-sigma factor FlgM [Leptonema sp. (in: Bacteria)]|nr:flagellar biosynthesis anti-sigma factor FlgM [Leptonema sp. (in: bacteria)]